MTEEVHVTHSVIRYMGDPRLCVSGSVCCWAHCSLNDRQTEERKEIPQLSRCKNFSTHSLLLLLRCLRFTYLFNPRIRVARIVLLYNRMWSLVCTQSWWDSLKQQPPQQRHSPYPDQLDCVQWCPFAVTLAEVTGWIAVLCIVSLWSLSTVDDGGTGVNRLTLLINNHRQPDECVDCLLPLLAPFTFLLLTTLC